MPKTLVRANPASLDPALIALKPRQVLLANRNPIPIPIPITITMKHTNHKPLLLQSVAQFLDSNGFSKTLKKFLSEAQIEKDGLKVSSLDLEEMYYKYLEMCDDANTKLDSLKEQDTKTDDTNKRDGDGDLTVAVKTVTKKNKKRSKESNGDAIANQTGATGKLPDSKNSEELIANHAAPGLNLRSKEKKKSNKISDSLGQGTEQVKSEVLKETADLIVCESTLEEPDKKCKEKKKKKSKLDSESLVDSVEYHKLESLPGTTEEKSKDTVASEGKSVAGSKTEKKSKDKKKKDEFKTPDEDVASKEKKESKKRKRLSSEENDSQPLEKKAAEENGDFEGQANGNFEENGEKSALQKSKKQRNGSVEPKSVKPFQRVKVDEVVFSDERLRDNSYWAKEGAESGYGAKAEGVLGQVRGRDFRHEKTKKKRGSYRGGQIDLQSHSVKFSYSDDE